MFVCFWHLRTALDVVENAYERHLGLEKNVYIQVSLKEDGRDLCYPLNTQFNQEESLGQLLFKDTLVFPLTYSMLPEHAVLEFNCWEKRFNQMSGKVEKQLFCKGGCSIFSSKGRLLTGRRKLALQFGSKQEDLSASFLESEQEASIRQFASRGPSEVPWLDELTSESIRNLQSSNKSSQLLFLHLELPSFSYPVYYADSRTASVVGRIDKLLGDEIVELEISKGVISEKRHVMEVVGEMFDKLQKSSYANPDAVPQPHERKEIDRILGYSRARPLTAHEKGLLWKYQYFLKAYKRGSLLPYLRAVNWNLIEKNTALSMLADDKWVMEKEETPGLLELLTGEFREIVELRAFCVSKCLRVMSDEELQLYMLQLVNCIRVELEWNTKPVTDFLLKRAIKSPSIATDLRWKLFVDNSFKRVLEKLIGAYSQVCHKKSQHCTLNLFFHFKGDEGDSLSSGRFRERVGRVGTGGEECWK